MKLVLMDLDGVLYPFTEALRVHLLQRDRLEKQGEKKLVLPGNEPDPYPMPARTWNFYKDQWGMTTQEFFSAMDDGVSNGALWWVGPPLPGAEEGMTMLSVASDVRIAIITHRSPNGKTHAGRMATRHWLSTEGIMYDHLEVVEKSSDKALVTEQLIELYRPDAVFALDDYIGNAEAYAEVRHSHSGPTREMRSVRSYLQTATWNENISVDLPRVDTVVEFAKHVLEAKA